MFILCYADDIILLAGRNLIDVNAKLAILKEYCSLNSLQINYNKSKIIYFSNNNRQKKLKVVKVNDEIITMDNNVTNLGVPFSFNGKFYQASK